MFTMSEDNFTLSYARFRFTLEATEDCMLPPYLGSTLRGAMGKALHQMLCLLPDENCQRCMHRWQCAYAYIMATGREETNSDGKTRIQPLPVPYVIEPPDEKNNAYSKGDFLHFHLLLIGNAISFTPLFISAFEKAALSGLGSGRKPFLLRNVEQADNDLSMQIWAGGNQLINTPKPIELNIENIAKKTIAGVRLQLLTPLRLVDKGKLNQEPDFSVLMRAVFRRLDSLGQIHGQGKLVIDFRTYLEAATKIKASTGRIKWHDWERYSNPQDSFLKMGGITGEINYKGELAMFLPYLKMMKFCM